MGLGFWGICVFLAAHVWQCGKPNYVLSKLPLRPESVQPSSHLNRPNHAILCVLDAAAFAQHHMAPPLSL